MVESIKKIFERLIPILILISIIDFSISTLPDLHPDTRTIINWIEGATVLIFTIEYLFNIFFNGGLKYIISFYGIIDILAILPFYLSTGIDLRSIRLFRLIRILRLLKLAKYSSALNRLGEALKTSKEELIIFSFATLILLYLAGVGIYYFENPVQPKVFASVFDGLWWAVATLTTVGYGDAYPITAGGRFFTFIILMLGLGVVAVPTGIVSSALQSIRRSEASKSK